jgi:hypothetical protein
MNGGPASAGVAATASPATAARAAMKGRRVSIMANLLGSNRGGDVPSASCPVIRLREGTEGVR